MFNALKRRALAALLFTAPLLASCTAATRPPGATASTPSSAGVSVGAPADNSGTGVIFGGTDPISRAATSERNRLGLALDGIGQANDDLCTLSQRRLSSDDFFRSLPTPSDEQMAACRSLLAMADLASHVANDSDYPLRTSTSPLFLDPPANTIALLAKVPIATPGTIRLSPSFLAASYIVQMIAVGHELLHTLGVTYDATTKSFRSTPGQGHLDADVVAGLTVRELFDYVASAWALRTMRNSVPYDFGGMYGFADGAAVVNPATGGSSCPVGYLSQQVSGSAGDAPLYACYRPKVAGQSPALDFGGAFGYVGGTPVANPLTGQASCPETFTETRVLNTDGSDLPVSICTRPHQAATAEPFAYGGMYGYVDGHASPNPATGELSCPSGYLASQISGAQGVDAPIFVCYGVALPLDYGGSYGYQYGGAPGAFITNPNPATGKDSCPAGYFSHMFIGKVNFDYPVVNCYRPHLDGAEPAYDFGGMFGSVNGAPAVNPLTNASSCPAGFTARQVTGTPPSDAPLYVCSKAHVAGTPSPYLFGGAFGTVDTTAPNPATGDSSCPTGYLKGHPRGTVNFDWDAFYCVKPN